MRPFESESNPRVLVIDEDSRIADSLAFALDISGFRAKAAYTGQQAIELAAMQSFQFVVSDALAEINGVKAALAIDDLLPNCRVLLMSGNADAIRFVEQARAGGHRFDAFPKPAHPELLIEKLRE